jgi:hypothetical protein
MSYNHIKRTEEKQFIDNMIFLMEEKGWKHKQIVTALGDVKLNTFKAWYYKRTFPPLAYCRKIAVIFGYTLEEMTTEALIKKSYKI